MAPTMMEWMRPVTGLRKEKGDMIKEAEEMCQTCISAFKDALSCEEDDYCSGSGIDGHGHALFFLIGLSLCSWIAMI